MHHLRLGVRCKPRHRERQPWSHASKQQGGALASDKTRSRLADEYESCFKTPKRITSVISQLLLHPAVVELDTSGGWGDRIECLKLVRNYEAYGEASGLA